MFYCVLCLVFVVVGAPSCSDEVTDLSSAYSEEDDLIKGGGKNDTGYYSSLAAELEGTYSSRLQLDVTALSESERQADLVESVSDTDKLQTIAQEQVRLSKRQLGDKLLHLNLTKGDMVMGDIALVNLEDQVVLQAEFSVNVELLVTVKELVDVNTTMDELVGTTHKITVAGDPWELSEVSKPLECLALSDGSIECLAPSKDCLAPSRSFGSVECLALSEVIRFC